MQSTLAFCNLLCILARRDIPRDVGGDSGGFSSLGVSSGSTGMVGSSSVRVVSMVPTVIYIHITNNSKIIIHSLPLHNNIETNKVKKDYYLIRQDTTIENFIKIIFFMYRTR